MGRCVAIYGKSGSGKTRSLKNFTSEEIQVFNVLQKDLPFRSKFSHILPYTDYEMIKIAMKKATDAGIKVIAVDDCGYLMAGKYLDQIGEGEKKGRGVFDFYNSIAHDFWTFCNFIKKELPQDTIVYLLMHENTDENGEVRISIIGRQLAEKTKMWEWVAIALRCKSENGQHFFCTLTDGTDITKAPEEMFEKDKIENDLKAVDKTIREYYGIN